MKAIDVILSCRVLRNCVLFLPFLGGACDESFKTDAVDTSDDDTIASSGFGVMGQLLNLENQPIPDLFVTVSTEYCIPDKTDEDGEFVVQEVTTGHKRLITYGNTTDTDLVASLSFAFNAEEEYRFPNPIFLPRFDESWPIDEDAIETQVITTADDLILTIPPESLTLAPFAPPALQVARVPVESAPDFLPTGVDLLDLFVLHPILSTFNQPAPISFPIIQDLEPDTPIYFYTLNYQTGVMESVATGMVDEDGRPSTGPEQGIFELTWVGISTVVEQ